MNASEVVCKNTLEPHVMHFSHWASQPTVLLACGGEADISAIINPQYGKAGPEQQGYTFSNTYVTCPNCIDWLIENWHNNTNITDTLVEYLGWSEHEYKLFVEKNSIPEHRPLSLGILR